MISSSADLSSGWDGTNLHRVSDQFSSLGSMDSLEHVSHPYPAGQLSPAKSNNSMEHLGGGKRDSAYSSFSTSSGTPDYSLSKSNAASTENVLYKVSQWDAGGKQTVKPDDRVAYFQMPGVSAGYEAPQTEDIAVSRHSTSSRTSFGPVWHVPERKKSSSPSPPPPPPPTRSDSFAATKVHERGMVLAHPEGPDAHVPCKASTENRRSHSLSLKNDCDNSNTSSDKSSHNQFASNKKYSLSSSDVPQGQHYHKRQHSDKSTFYPQPWTTSGTKPQSVGGYYCSMQELPTNGSAHQFGQNHRRNLSTSLSTIATEQFAESGGQSRYYCVTTCQPNSQPLLGRPEERINVTGVELAQTGNEDNSLSPQTVTKMTYHLPQQHSSHSKDSNGYSKQQVTNVPETTVPKPNSDDKARVQNTQNADAQYALPSPSRQSEQRRSLPLQNRELPQDIRHHSQVSSKISPHATPMLHSLSMDTAGQEEKVGFAEESIESKQMKRSDRFATTLRNEIQMRRAKLQKSKSAENGAESTTNFTNSYKDHLKEAQARVLKATSFRRKDLEPVLVENPAAETLPNYPPSVLGRKDVAHLPTVTESATGKSGHAASQVTRIGGRKRFTAEEKVRSFSEPDKIHEVGVKADLSHNEVSSSLDKQKEIRSKEYTEEAQGVPYSAPKQSVQDQQRLGTFAEYEAQWNIQKKPPETRASGRYGSADNILDSGPEERTKTACFHARSKSSPLADMYEQVRHKSDCLNPKMTEMYVVQ